MNFTSNLMALTVFAISGNINIYAGITMVVGQVIGARIGSNLAIEKGTSFIRLIFLLIVFLTIIRLLYKNYF